MKDYRIISSLCYFSIFFAGFIFPLAVYFIVQDDEVKYHAKKALISHILPFITFIAFIISIITMSLFSMVTILILIIIIDIVIVIWNIIQGIKIFI